jgi:hypothetical protein
MRRFHIPPQPRLAIKCTLLTEAEIAGAPAPGAGEGARGFVGILGGSATVRMYPEPSCGATIDID